ncbi:HEAT repeat domain-containing protein [Coralliovum pocilloporae]|uniref:HEAT repeat domain-containing protein n=1 Tax=Coralliovum pocilloporae TaxID=3066369 RepID=UPI003306E16E
MSVSETGKTPFGLDDAKAVFRTLVSSDYDIVRLKAVQALHQVQATDSADCLVEALRDDDEDVRIDAVSALADLGDEAVIPALLENLVYDPCGEVKLACVKALGKLGGRDAIPYLRKLVTSRSDDDEMIWDEDEAYQTEWDDWLDIQIAAIETLGRFGDEEAVEPIVLAVNDDEAQDLGPVAMEALGRIGDAALPSLGMFMNSTRRRLRYQATRAVAGLDGEKAEALLNRALDDKDASIRLVAFETLLDRDASLDLFERALGDAHEDIRIAAFARLDLAEEALLNRVLNDPSPVVQLSLINRIDPTESCERRDDTRFRTLELLSRSGNGEVAATAFGRLAAIATPLVKNELIDLFGDREDKPDDLERRQWAAVDGLAASANPDAMEWLQKACRSEFRAVRLKALTAVGVCLERGDKTLVARQQASEIVLSLALPAPAADPGDEDADIGEQEAVKDDRHALKAAGLDIGDGDADAEQGPTSSLGAILGHEEIAEELVEEAAADNSATILSPNEEILLNRARRNISRRKVALDADAASLDQETQLTAIQLLGTLPDWQGNLLSLATETDVDRATAALDGLLRSIDRFGLKAGEDALADVIPNLIVATDAGIRLRAVRLTAFLPLDKASDILLAVLGDEDANVRAEAIRLLGGMTVTAEAVTPLLGDSSSLVRQQAMRTLCVVDPAQARDHLLSFLLDNPEQSLTAYMPDDSSAAPVIGAHIADRLANDNERATWPVLLPALASLYQTNGLAVAS